MTSIKRFSFALALTLLTLDALAQTPQVSTVNVTPDESKVRISAGVFGADASKAGAGRTKCEEETYGQEALKRSDSSSNWRA